MIRLRPRLPVTTLRWPRSASDRPWLEAVGRTVEWFAFGRDALWSIARRLDPATTVFVPGYSCAQLVDPFIDSGLKVVAYEIDADFHTDWSELIEMAQGFAGPRVLLTVDFFGFLDLPPGDVEGALAATFAVAIRDGAHRLPPVEREHRWCPTSYHVYSYRKPLPVPDGAILVTETDEVVDGGLGRSGDGPQDASFVAFETIGLLFPWPTRLPWFQATRTRLKARHVYGVRPSELGRSLISALDVEAARGARRRNAEYLTRHIGGHVVFQEVPVDACPYYLPVYVEDNVGVARSMRSGGIETTTMWPAVSALGPAGPAVRWIREHILCLPTHQGLRTSDLAAIVRTFREAAGTSAPVRPARRPQTSTQA